LKNKALLFGSKDNLFTFVTEKVVQPRLHFLRFYREIFHSEKLRLSRLFVFLILNIYAPPNKKLRQENVSQAGAPLYYKKYLSVLFQ
ncbi:hypothetical protein, partial [Chryseobacterium taichungense]|uniref:hypothetical protein n=1 Tax=Chryseobacterium taichungense TaxID=295069 RepID=UPI0028B0E7D7